MEGMKNMKKSMKQSALKTVVVKCLNWQEIVVVDSDIFDDYHMEAATRVIEKKNGEQNFKIAVIMECWEKKDFKKPNKHFVYNTYFVLINASLQNKAELLRINFLQTYGVDLKNETLKGEGNSGGNEPNNNINN